MAKAIRFDVASSTGLVSEACDALKRAAAILMEANCPGAAALAQASARRASKAVRKKKTLMLDTLGGRD